MTALAIILYILGVIDAWFCHDEYGVHRNRGYYARLIGWPIHTSILIIEAVWEHFKK